MLSLSLVRSNFWFDANTGEVKGAIEMRPDQALVLTPDMTLHITLHAKDIVVSTPEDLPWWGS